MGAVEVAQEGLCKMIAAGTLVPGQALPTEAELCEQLGVSRSSLREAQKMLVVAGVLASRRGSGAYVSEMNPDQILSGLRIVVPLLPLERYLEFFPMREVLEGHMAALAAARMSGTEARRLCALAERLRGASSIDEAQALDNKFHARIIAGGEDPMMAALLESLRRRGHDYRILEFDEGRGAEIKRLSDEAHVQIATAILNKDPEGAKSLMTQHIRTTKLWLEGLRPKPVIR